MAVQKGIEDTVMFVDTEEEFCPERVCDYPAHITSYRNEELVFNKFSDEINTDRYYLPILWTNYYVGKNDEYRINEYLNCIDDGKREYWTVCDYADGPKGLPDNMRDRVLVFSSTDDSRNKIPIPLLCDKYDCKNLGYESDYTASFVGSLETHPIRKKMCEYFKTNDNYCVLEMGGREKFLSLMSNSAFALCPRGYSKTSFRLYQAISIGCIPVYISDKFHLPMPDVVDWNNLCILFNYNEKCFGELQSMLDERANSKHYLIKKREYINEVNKKWFCHEFLYEYIKNKLETE